MKTRHLIALLFAISFSYSAFSQMNWHINAGGVNSNWRGDGLNIFSKVVDVVGSNFLTQQGYNSVYAGGSVQLPLGERFSVEPGLQYSRVGATLKGNLAVKALSLLGISGGARAISQRIELPVVLNAEVVKGLSLFAGPQLNYAFSNKVQVHAGVLGINLINKKFDVNNRVEPITVSAIGGVKYQFVNGFNFKAAYEYGLTGIAKNNIANLYQNSFRVGVGIPLNGRDN